MTKFVELAHAQKADDFRLELQSRMDERIAIALESRKTQMSSNILDEGVEYHQRFVIAPEFKGMYDEKMHGHLSAEGQPYTLPKDTTSYIKLKNLAGHGEAVPCHHIETVPGTGEFKMHEETDHLKKGAFHSWLGKSEKDPITNADIERGIKAGGHPAKMAIQARNFGVGK